MFKVDESDDSQQDDESGRIIFLLEYDGETKKDRGFTPKRVTIREVAKVKIQRDDIYAIVPVIKVLCWQLVS